MDLRRAIHELVSDARAVGKRLHGVSRVSPIARRLVCEPVPSGYVNRLTTRCLVAFVAMEIHESKGKESASYKSLQHEKEVQLAEARAAITLACRNPTCQQRMRFGVEMLHASANGGWTCPKCKKGIDPFECLMNQ